MSSERTWQRLDCSGASKRSNEIHRSLFTVSTSRNPDASNLGERWRIDRLDAKDGKRYVALRRTHPEAGCRSSARELDLPGAEKVREAHECARENGSGTGCPPSSERCLSQLKVPFVG